MNKMIEQNVIRELAGLPPMGPMKRHPKHNCKKCYGRGVVGWEADSWRFVLCPCTV